MAYKSFMYDALVKEKLIGKGSGQDLFVNHMEVWKSIERQ